MTKADRWMQDVGDSLKAEIDGDAPLIAKELFGDKQPDSTVVSDTDMGRLIGQAYQRGDRLYLHRLARSNPKAFLQVWKNLGGSIPPEPMTPNA